MAAKAARGRVVALGGNPNVGKSTLFNALTGLRQHTGNWPGKTVINAEGICEYNGTEYTIIDLPGCYSLVAHSAEEEAARDYIYFGGADAIIIVCDATCLERNLNVVLQTLEITRSVVVCVNLMDEAGRKKIELNLPLLSERLGVPVVGTSARANDGLDWVMEAVERVIAREGTPTPFGIHYPDYIEDALEELIPCVSRCETGIDARRLSLLLVAGDEASLSFISENSIDILENEDVARMLEEVNIRLAKLGISKKSVEESVVAALVETAESICGEAVLYCDNQYRRRDIKIDAILTGRRTAFPIMLLALIGIFWITITGANYPSQMLSDFFFRIEEWLLAFFVRLNAPKLLYQPLVLGVYRTLAWVVSVMLPPMAIFFPLFTLLEDAGVLPRVAFNLDRCFRKCRSCGKQALTMCMGFGCNAVGVIGCRIIDSPRERLIAILTNSLVPCNGRFPALIAIISMFFAGAISGSGGTLLSSVLLSCVIVLSVIMTFAASMLLSATLLKGAPSSFTLELPPYRRPQIAKVVVRSVFDRTLFVLARAVSVAAPAGLVIWFMANVYVGDATLLEHSAGFLDPFARLLGMDGVILMAFILGFPANEIVIPIIIMAYQAQGNLTDIESLGELRGLLVENGWTWVTAVCVTLFSLMHWPCSTTVLTIRKETGSAKWTAIGMALPALAGIAACFVFNASVRLLTILFGS